jgi:hypothetical protein
MRGNALSAIGCFATYADVDAASEEDPDKAKEIEAACVSGGNFFVGFITTSNDKTTSSFRCVSHGTSCCRVHITCLR